MTITGFKLISILTSVMGLAIICVNIYIDNDPSLVVFPTAIVPGPTEEFAIVTPGCKIPQLDPFHPSVREYITDYTGKHLECTSIPMVSAVNHTLIINKEHPKYQAKTRCHYKDIYRKKEDSTGFGKAVSIDRKKGTTVTNEFVVVECFNGRAQKVYQDFFSFIIRKPKVEERCAKVFEKTDKSQSLNVLLLGLDSVSKNSYIRHMHLVDKYIREKLTFIELHGYNKLGLNTYPNMIPFHTGKMESEYPFDHKKTDLNELPMVWKEFATAGYRTLFAEDCSNMASFNYLKRGFDAQPTDYYMRPFSIAVDASEMKKKLTEGCYHNRTEPSVVYKWILDFFNEFPNDPLFAYTFLTRLSHDNYNTVAYYDKPIFDFLKAMNTAGHLNKTIVFFLSDHGYRFGSIRTTYVGHLEDKLPYFFFFLPDWFPEKYPEYYKSLQLNERRLTTPLDMHATLLDILSDLHDLEEDPDPNNRSISLFTPMPLNRTCTTANIESQYCTCFERQRVSVNDEAAKNGTILLLKYVNELLNPVKNECASLELKEIIEAAAHDVEINKDKKEMYTNYMITFEVNPSMALFQGIALYNHMTNKYTIEKNIDRLNKYGNQSECIDDPHLRLFCYCKINLA